MDKKYVWGDAIRYMKDLEERVQTLEEQAMRRRMEPVEDEESSDERSGNSGEQPLPDVVARVCDRNILLKILCEKRKGNLVKIIGEVEKLNLTVVTSSVASFGNLALDITIVAQMEKESRIPVRDVVAAIHSVLEDME